MIKTIPALNSKPIDIPRGFHVIDDLVPFREMNGFLGQKPLSKEAKLRLKWMDFYARTKNASLTCRHFGLARKTFYYWLKRYDPSNLKTLEQRSRRPKQVRVPTISSLAEQRIYREKISFWQIQRTIIKYHLYCQPIKVKRAQVKRLKATRKKRITELVKEPKEGFLVCLDAIVIYGNNLKRYIFTAIDCRSGLAFARMYSSKSSKSARDFFKRIHYLYQAQIDNLQTDNGSEFEGYFAKAIAQLPKKIQRYFSGPHTPKDNPVNEKFNQTLEKEFLELGNFTPNVKMFNKNLTEWLIEYNFNRPHQTLNYQTPVEFHYQHQKVLPMCPSSAYY